MNKFATHLPVLELIHSLYPYKTVLEFGCGSYSTKYFVDNCDSVTSIEMQSQEWYDKIKAEINSNKLKLFYMPGEEGIEWFKNTKDKYDFIFVDGMCRIKCINAAFNRTSVITVHDYRFHKYKNRGLQKNNDYEFILMKTSYPLTGILTSNSELAEKIKKHKYCIKAKWVN